MTAAKRLDALNQTFGRPKTEHPVHTMGKQITPDMAKETARPPRAPSREGKLHISAWLLPAFKVSLRAVQMKHPEKTLQDLFSEALNDLFAKYNVPTVRED